MDIKEEEAEIKKEFQLERVILFTDAVFAIILTIMVLDLKLPEGIRELTEEKLQHEFKGLIFKFLGYLITFALVARFWMVHLKLFRFLKDYDSKLLVLNLVFLFCISLFPFAVSLITGNVHIQYPEYSWAYTIYICIVYSVVFAQAIITWYLLKKKETLCINTPLLDENFKWKVQRVNMIVIPLLILVVLGFNYYKVPTQYDMYTLAVYGVIINRVSKKYYPSANNGPILFRLIRSIKLKRANKKIATAKPETEEQLTD